jgi:hypothetical protein
MSIFPHIIQKIFIIPNVCSFSISSECWLQIRKYSDLKVSMKILSTLNITVTSNKVWYDSPLGSEIQAGNDAVKSQNIPPKNTKISCRDICWKDRGQYSGNARICCSWNGY